MGNFGKRFGWSAKIDHLNLGYCKACFRRETEYLLGITGDPFDANICHRCCRWDMSSTSSANKKVSVSEKYPRFADNGSPTPPANRKAGNLFLLPAKLDWNFLLMSVRYAAHNVRKGVWSKAVMEDYLNTCCVPQKVVDGIWKYCSPRSPEFLNDDDERYIPSIWLSTVPMHSFIETVMHLLFHGIVASIMSILEKFMSDHGKKNII